MNISGNLEFNMLEENQVKKDRLVISNRDREIVAFCLEMKFSTIEQIYSKFFKKTNDGCISLSDRWARERVSKLKRFGYLKSQKNHETGESLMLTTPKGYQLLNNGTDFNDLSKPLATVDFRQFAHDKFVIDCRLLLETSRKAVKWISERSLQSTAKFKKAFGEETVADGLYLSQLGTATFFELELTQKGKDRYKRKVSRYVSLLRSGVLSSDGIKSVHFVCGKESILTAISRECEIYGDLFKVESIADFQAANSVRGSDEGI